MIGSVTLAREVIHTAADGKRYLVLHGHQFDGLTHFNRVLVKVRRDDSEMMGRLLRMGCMGFVAERSSPSVLGSAIRALARGALGNQGRSHAHSQGERPVALL